MKLSGEDFQKLLTAILNCYPDLTDLRMLVRFELDETFDEIAGGDNNKQKIFNLIEWAESRATESTDKLNLLIKALLQDRPQEQIFQELNNKLNPSVFNSMELSVDDSQAITPTEWNELYSILKDINNNQLITQICRQTLKNSQNDLLGNCLELSSIIDLKNLKEILLKKITKRNDNVPTILEFSERLSNKIEQQLSKQLDRWIETIATRLKIDLPTYSDNSRLSSEDKTYKYFLLITAIPKGKNQFELESDLLLYDSPEDSYQPIPKFLNCEERNLIKCDFTEIKDKIFDLVQICQEYLQFPYILNVQLFLTYPYLGHAFDLEEIVIDKKRKTSNYLGNQYPLLVSSYDRFNNKSFYNEFLLRWRTNVQEKLKPNLAKLIESLKELEVESYNHQSLDELAHQWRVEKVIGLKIIGCWSDVKEVQEELFYSLVRSGIPLALWSRCNDLQNCQQHFNNLLTSEPLKTWHDLFEKIWDCRQKAYKKPEKIGYHLGILSDDPQRIPSNLKPLIETGK